MKVARRAFGGSAGGRGRRVGVRRSGRQPRHRPRRSGRSAPAPRSCPTTAPAPGTLPAFDRALRGVGARTVFFQRQRLVGVRGTAVELRRAARLPGVRGGAHGRARSSCCCTSRCRWSTAARTSRPGRAGSTGAAGRWRSSTRVSTAPIPACSGRMAANVKVARPGRHLRRGRAGLPRVPGRLHHRHDRRARHARRGHGRRRRRALGGLLPRRRAGVEARRAVGRRGGRRCSTRSAPSSGSWPTTRSTGSSRSTTRGGRAATTCASTRPTRSTSRSKAMTTPGSPSSSPPATAASGARAEPAGRSDCASQPADGGGREPTDGALQDQPVLGRAVGDVGGERAQGRGRRPGRAAPGLLLVARRPDPAEVDRRPDDRLRADADRARHEHPLRAGRRRGTTDAWSPAGRPRRRRACRRRAPRPYEPFYMPLSGTSMASPHVAGAVAVLQSKAQAALGRRLTPAEVRSLLVDSATPMTGVDGLWDWPCGQVPIFVGVRRAGRRDDRQAVRALAGRRRLPGRDRRAGPRRARLGAAPASERRRRRASAPAPLPSSPPAGGSVRAGADDAAGDGSRPPRAGQAAGRAEALPDQGGAQEDAARAHEGARGVQGAVRLTRAGGYGATAAAAPHPQRQRQLQPPLRVVQRASPSTSRSRSSR